MRKLVGVLVCCICLLVTTSKAQSIKCLRNEVLACCKNPCEPSCQNPYRQPCPTFVCQPGCMCKPGTLRDEISGICVNPRCCPRTCDKNQVWRECSDIYCRETCQKPKPDFCPLVCIPGCSCKQGFIWDEYLKKCVPRYQCAKACRRYVPTDAVAA